MLRPTIRVLLPVSFALLTGCGGGSTEPENRAPIARISADPTVVPEGDNHQTVVRLDGSGSTDADGDPLSFQWTVQSATFVNNTNTSSQVAQVTFPGDAPYAVMLRVTDGQGGSGLAETTIALGPAGNRAPIAVATADPSVVPAGDNFMTVVTLDASGSSDPDGDPLTFLWSVPSGVFVNNTTNTDPTPQVTFPGTGDYEVRVVVSDGNGLQAEATVVVRLG